MFRFSLREILWLTLVVAVVTAWRLEAVQTARWREQAEIALNQLEIESLKQMALNDRGVFFRSPTYDPPLREVNNQISLSR